MKPPGNARAAPGLRGVAPRECSPSGAAVLILSGTFVGAMLWGILEGPGPPGTPFCSACLVVAGA